MIPLRSTDGVAKFPRASLALLLIFLLFNFVALWSEELLLPRLGAFPGSDLGRYVGDGILAALLSPSLFKLSVNLLFFWVFSPQVFQKSYRVVLFFFWGIGGAMLARESFYRLHPDFHGPLPAFDATIGVLLGMSLPTQIWATVSTVVVGWGWVRIFEVPAYVLLFFWLFYLFLGNLFLKSPFSDAPMLYWLPFVGLLVGFFGEMATSLMGRVLWGRQESRSET